MWSSRDTRSEVQGGYTVKDGGVSLVSVLLRLSFRFRHAITVKVYRLVLVLNNNVD